MCWKIMMHSQHLVTFCLASRVFMANRCGPFMSIEDRESPRLAQSPRIIQSWSLILQTRHIRIHRCLAFEPLYKDLRVSRDSFLIEPFSPLTTKYKHHPHSHSRPKRYMYVGSNEMQIQEIDVANGIETNVTYFTLPEEDFGALVRRVTITNMFGHQSLNISVLDGLARMEPAGGELNKLLKGIGRTLEGWFGVYFPYKDSLTMPFYKLSTQPSDSASVTIQQAGHYCLSMIDGDPSKLLPIVYDSSKVFGEDTMLLRPIELKQQDCCRNPKRDAIRLCQDVVCVCCRYNLIAFHIIILLS